MFQKYDVSKNRGPKKCRDSAYAERMILYAGANHNKHVALFLKEMFGIKPVFYVSMRNTKKISPAYVVYNDPSYPPVTQISDFIRPFL